MKKNDRDIILDIYIFDQLGNIASVDRDQTDIYECDVLSMIILKLPVGEHPIEYIKKYIKQKKLSIIQLELLPAIFLNQFDSEPNKDYLVFSFKISIKKTKRMCPDFENKNIKWMPFNQFKKHPKLMPELKKNSFEQIFNGESLFYRGIYKDSDGSNSVLKWHKV